MFPVPPLNLDDEYRARVQAMTPVERVNRAVSLFAWSQGLLERSVTAEQPTLSSDRLKWEVALRQYGADPKARLLIDELRRSAARSRLPADTVQVGPGTRLGPYSATSRSSLLSRAR